MGYQDGYKPRWLAKLDDLADWFQGKTWNPLYEWLTGEPYVHKNWHSWIHHTLIAGTFVIPFALFGHQMLGAVLAFVGYFLRELLTVAKYQGWRVSVDNIMDIVGPGLILWLSTLGG